MLMKGLSDKQIYCFMDYETTGIDTTKNSWTVPIQIGCVFADRDMECLLEYQNMIKWDQLMNYEDWVGDQVDAAKVHKISHEDVQNKGYYPYVIKRDLLEIVKELQSGIGTKKRAVIVSDAPNFEMFFTEMIWGSKGESSWPFYYNAWSVYPLFQIFGVRALYGQKPHDALDDARLLLKGMQEVWRKAKELKML